ncbi:MAG: choline-sulfatase, partial [Gammaproteobacteria bacterium]|nr:choline-sulfatase [Gammaproteobacteria bacterium]
TVLGEYTGEGSIDPLLMIRRQQWKFNFCETDPAQLFDLENDPLESANLAADPAYRKIVSDFNEEVHARWNLNTFRRDVSRSQQNRLRVYRGLREGKFTAWDHQVVQDAGNRYMRNHLDLNKVEATARFPAKKN